MVDQVHLMNIDKFYEHKNIFYIPGTTDMKEKRKLINSCDAMIHARDIGESFGLACGEFAVCNKPIITYANSQDRNHLDILGNHAVTYKNYRSLFSILSSFTKTTYDVTQNGYHEYTPEKVMKIFNDIFLK